MFFLSSTAVLWTTIAIMLLAIQVIVFIHELGHYIVAKYNGVRIAEFAVGMGPVLYSWRRKGTTYSFRLLPIGGYVAVLSKSAIEEIDKIKEAQLTPEQLAFVQKKLRGLSLNDDYSWQKPIESLSWSKRAWFSGMGILFNFASAFLMLIATYATVGKNAETESNLIFLPLPGANNKMAMLNNIWVFADKPHQRKTINGFSQKKNFLHSPISYIEDEYNWEKSDWVYADKTDDLYSSFNNGIPFLTRNPDSGPIEPFSYWIRVAKEGDRYGSNNTKEVKTKSSGTADSDFTWALPHDNQNTLKGFYATSETVWIKEYDDETMAAEVYTTKADTWTLLISPHNITDVGGIYTGLFQGVDSSAFDNRGAVLEAHTLGGAIVEASTDIWGYFTNSWIFVADFFSFGAASKAFGVTNTVITNINPSYWIFTILNMIILLSVVLGSFNLLPLPPLDGFKITEAFYNKISGKEIPPELNAKLSRVGWIVIMALFFASFLLIF